MLLRCHAAGKIKLSPEEVSLLVAALRQQPELGVFSDQYAARLLGLLAVRPDLMAAPTWADALCRCGSVIDGNMMRADSAMVDVATKLFDAHPLEDIQWWTAFWVGLADGAGGTHARRALCDAVATWDPARRESGWHALATLEDVQQPAGNTGLLVVGLTMRGHIAAPAALSSIAHGAQANWKRALLWALAPEDLWPHRKQAPDDAVRAAVVETLRQPPQAADEMYWRLDLIGRSWGVLGAPTAAQEFCEFVAAPRADLGEAALRVAVVAYEVGINEKSRSVDDQQAFDAAEQAVTALLVSSRYSTDRLIARVLEHSKLGERAAREVLIRALGTRISTLSKETYDRLVR
jgi:hypothetical protein